MIYDANDEMPMRPNPGVAFSTGGKRIHGGVALPMALLGKCREHKADYNLVSSQDNTILCEAQKGSPTAQSHVNSDMSSPPDSVILVHFIRSPSSS
jgi:hypothetical protein